MVIESKARSCCKCQTLWSDECSKVIINTWKKNPTDRPYLAQSVWEQTNNDFFRPNKAEGSYIEQSNSAKLPCALFCVVGIITDNQCHIKALDF